MCIRDRRKDILQGTLVKGNNWKVILVYKYFFFFLFIFWIMFTFLLVDLLCRLTPTAALALRSCLRIVPSWSRTLSPAKTKWHPSGRLHSDAQVSIRAKKHQVCILALVLETAYLTRVLRTLYIGWNWGLPLRYCPWLGFLGNVLAPLFI